MAVGKIRGKGQKEFTECRHSITCDNNDINFELGRTDIFPHCPGCWQSESDLRHLSLPTCCFLWMSLHFLASYLPKFRLRKVQAHLRKQVSRLESKTKPSGLKASSFSRGCALPAASPVAQWVKNPLAMWAPGFDPQVGKIPWRRAWQAAPVFLPGDSHGQRSLGGCSPWGPRVGHD